MAAKLITLRKLNKNISRKTFLEAYTNLFMANDITSIPIERQYYLLKLAIIFLNYGDPHVEKLGYRIILRYSNMSKDYKPLYDIAISLDLIPVAKLIETRFLDKTKIENRFNNLFLSAYKENFKEIDKYITLGQKDIMEFVKEAAGDFAVIAPTSYGKTDIIISKIGKSLSKKICVIVPTKALLAQMRKRIMNN